MKPRLTVEHLEERTLLSNTPSYVPLDQLFTQGILKAGSLRALSLQNIYSPDVNHQLAPAGTIPPGAVEVGLNSETGAQVFAVANKYVAQIDITGLTGAAATDPKLLLGRAEGELALAKIANPNDTVLAGVKIEKYLGGGAYLVSASTNVSLGSAPLLQPALAKIPGFQNVEEDFLFPSSALTAGGLTAGGPSANVVVGPSASMSSSFPALTEIGAQGGLVFSGSTTGSVTSGNTTSYTIGLNSGQLLAAIVTPDSNLKAKITVTDASNHVIATATGSAAGALTAFQAVTLSGTGTYTVTVSGVGTTAGNFTLQLVVNAKLQKEQFLGGDIDSTLATAQQLDSSSINLGNGILASAVYGKIPLQTAAGDSFVSERGVGVQLVSAAGVVEATLNDPSLSAGTINDMHIGPDGNLYVGVDAAQPGLDGTAGEILEFSQSGTLLATINLPNDGSGGFSFYPFGFSIAADGSFWVAQPNSGGVAHVGISGNLIQSYATGGTPEWTTVRSDGQVFISDISDGNIVQLDPASGNTSTFANDPAGLPFGLSFTPAGSLLVADPNVGILVFNNGGGLTQVIQDFNAPIDASVDPSGNILAATAGGFFTGPSLDKFTAGGVQIGSTALNGLAIGLAVVGTEGPAPKPPQTVDYYKFNLAAGQTATVVLSDLGSQAASLALVGPAGNTLALGKVLNGSEQSIDSFVASAAGTYYVQVSGNGVQYDVVLEKGAAFGNGSNTALSSAQSLFATSGGNYNAVGSLAQVSLFGIEWQQAANQLIHAINPQNGAFLSTFQGPATSLTNPFGFNMAFDGQHLWFNDGAFSGSNTIFELDPTSGAVLNSFPSPTPELLGLAFLNGSLYGTDAVNIFQIDPNTGNLIGQFSPGLDGAVTGIAGDPTRGAAGTLWAVSQFHTLFQIDVATQSIVNAVPDGLSLNEQDLGYNNNELYVSETNGPGSNDIAVFDANTLALKRDMPVNVPIFISGLGADGFSLTESSYYSLSANPGDKLKISATTPYSDASKPFAPYNLSLILKLYDPNGNLVATSAASANPTLNYTATVFGKYSVQVVSANGNGGDFTLNVKGATAPAPAFVVTGTNPPAGAHVKPLSSITVDFNDTILLSSLPTASVTFGGKAATGFVVDNDHEVTWFVQALPPGLNVSYKFAIAGGAVLDIHGVGLSAFSETIIVNTVPPHLTSTSVEEGAVLNVGNLTYTVGFNEPLDPSTFSAASFDLHGLYHNTDYSPVSFSFNANNTKLTIKYSNLPEDAYTITLFSSGITDLAGYHLDGEPHTPRPPSVPSGNGIEGGDFFVDFTMRPTGSVALPITFSALGQPGTLIYQGSFTDVVAPNGASNTYTAKLAKQQTITLDLKSDSNLQGRIAIYDPSGNLIDSFSASGKGGEVLLQTEPVLTAGTYKIVVTGVNNTAGLFSIQATLNAALEASLHGGPSNGTIGTAQDLSGSFVTLGGAATRGAVLGSINQLVVGAGDIFVSERGGPGVIVVANAGGVISQLNDPAFATGTVQGIHEGPDGNIYVGLDTAPGTGAGGEILKFSIGGVLLATIKLPPDASGGFYYPFGFSIAPDGTFWVAQPNSGSVVHADAAGNLIQSYSVGGNPEWTGVRADGQIFVSNETGSIIQQLDPASGNVTTFASDPFGAPFGISFTAAGTMLVSDPDVGVLEYDGGGNLVNVFSDFGALDAQPDQNGNLFIANPDFNSLDELDQFGNFINFTNTPGTPIGMSVAGQDGPTPPPPNLNNYYSFKLDLGQSATITLDQYSGNGSADVFLVDAQGNVLATGQHGATNRDEVISNFVAPAAGTYYIKVTGNNVQYGVTVAKNAAMDTEPNNSQSSAQPLPASGAALGAVFVPKGVTVGAKLEGLSFNDTTCGCIPPDTNGAVGPLQVVETTNTAYRVYDKATGNVLLSGEIGTLFGIPAFSDPYFIYDDIAQRFVGVILTTNASGGDGLFFAVSKDSNILDGFAFTTTIDFGSNLLDFPKIGYNADAYVITGNLFTASNTPLQYIAIDKNQLFNGNFVDYLYQRDSSHFRAEVPAQMHGAAPGGPIYLVNEAGFGNGHATDVVTLTNELSNNPTFVDTDITVNPYGFPAPADQPGLSGSVATNDTTFTHLEWRNGLMVTAQSVSEPDDGFSTSRVRWYEFSTTGPVPTLVQQGTINPGPGVSTYYGTATITNAGDIGITYMESSANEFVSMYVAGRKSTDPLGTMSPGTAVAPGIQTGFNFFRAGDYSGIQVDPSDGTTFWAFNEYEGTNPVYNTFIASFTLTNNQDEDWYNFAAKGGNKLKVTLSLPGSSTGQQFVNTLSPVLELYDSNGNKVASGTTSISYTVPAGPGGTYSVRVLGANNTQGEYVVQVTGNTGTLMATAATAGATATGTGSHFATTVTGDSSVQASLSLLSHSPATTGPAYSAGKVPAAAGPALSGGLAAFLSDNGIASDTLFGLLAHGTGLDLYTSNGGALASVFGDNAVPVWTGLDDKDVA
jgi:sugar lactone lactonase YvrE